jgi:hypothetical protein
MRTVLLALLLAACATDTLDADKASLDAGALASADEEAAALSFVNHPTTSSFRLVDAGVPAGAAEALVRLRDGADALAGTDDDRQFGSLGTLLHLEAFGVEQVHRLVDAAAYEGWPQAAERDFGAVEGVHFTWAEAEASLAFANLADGEVLETVLDARAVNGILEARPFVDVAALAEARFVGPATLEALREAHCSER